MLCITCQTFDIQSFSRRSVPWRGIRRQQAIDGALSGCAFCTLLLESLEIPPSGVATANGRELGGWIHLKVGRDKSDNRGDDALNIVRLDACFDPSTKAASFLQSSSQAVASTSFHVVADNGE